MSDSNQHSEFESVRQAFPPGYAGRGLAALDSLEEQLEAAQRDRDQEVLWQREASERAQDLDKLIRRFLEWDALVGLPAELPAPFADMRYWVAEFERAVSSPASVQNTGTSHEA